MTPKREREEQERVRELKRSANVSPGPGAPSAVRLALRPGAGLSSDDTRVTQK